MNNYLYTFLYGFDTVWWDVTIQVYHQYVYKTIDPDRYKIILPKSDQQRCRAFKGDPYFMHEKSVRVINNSTKEDKIYNVGENIILYTDEVISCKRFELDSNDVRDRYYNEIRPSINLVYGHLDDELPEQLMSIKYISPELKILEIGTNVGRNTVIIASLLENQENLVSIECNNEYYNQALVNRELNHMKFHLKNTALSTKNVFQKGWNTITSVDQEMEGWEKVDTTTFDELQAEFNITFDTLILDCEGAFYDIWKEMPHILNNINLIIVENDYDNIKKYFEIRDELYRQGFCCVYQEQLQPGMCFHECAKYFFEVYSRV
jgi:FkbM family methyltransferase